VRIYRRALKEAFFEPRPAVLELYQRFNDPVKTLVEKWWDRISTSEKFAENLDAIRAYQARLRPGDVTLVGLIAEGGQGLATANNSRFLGYLQGTPQAQEIEAKREKWTKAWLADDDIRALFLELLARNGGDPARPTANVAAWEACVEPLKERFTARRLGFNRTDLYRIVPANLIATDEDFRFTWRRRKAELLERWRQESELATFWKETDIAGAGARRGSLRDTEDVPDEAFCRLCSELQAWARGENRRRSRVRQSRISRTALGLRSGEEYGDPADAPRIATIYNGLHGRGQWVPFRKGDPEGNRWLDNNPLFIDWRAEPVAWLFDNSGRPEPRMPVVRNAHLYFRPNVTWSRTANHTDMKARLQPRCVFDSDSTVLTPVIQSLPALAFLALLNSCLLSFLCKKLLNNTNKYEITDLRMLPVAIPGFHQARRLAQLAEWAITAKRLVFNGEAPSNELTAFARSLDQQLWGEGPPYLRPDAQMRLLDTAEACLGIIERAVNWEVERLYGVEGLGPFDEF
jgi:hypothetical protein